MVVGEARAPVEAGLGSDQFDLIDAPLDAPATDGEEVRGIASALRAYEAALDGGAVDRVVLAGSSDGALAAAIVATKLRVPVASVGGDDDPGSPSEPRSELNARLIAQLADTVLRDDATVISSWLRDAQSDSEGADGD
jgi:hypothetical protein